MRAGPRRMKGRTLTVSFAEPRQIDLQQQQQQQATPEPVKVRSLAAHASPALSATCCAVVPRQVLYVHQPVFRSGAWSHLSDSAWLGLQHDVNTCR